MEELLKMIDADLEAGARCTDSIDTGRSMLALRYQLKREEMRAKGVEWRGGVQEWGRRDRTIWPHPSPLQESIRE
jgi:hypothetical protein